MGQTFVVENRPGGNGTIGADNVAKAPADGYTLLLQRLHLHHGTDDHEVGALQCGRKTSRPSRSVAKAPLSVAINKNLPITDVKSLVAHAKANPGKMTFAVGSIGSAGHLSDRTAQARRQHRIHLMVPYKGTAPAFQDLIGGQIDGFIDPILGSLQYHKSGMLRVVAVTCEGARANLPDVPTVAETIPWLRVLQLVRAVGPGQVAERHHAATQRGGQQGAGQQRHAREAHAAGPAADARHRRKTSRSSSASDMAALAEDHHRRQHPCRMTGNHGPEDVKRRSGHGQQLGHWPGHRAGGCWTTAGRSPVSTGRRRASCTRRFSTAAGRPVRRRSHASEPLPRWTAALQALVHAAGVLRVGPLGALDRRRRAS